MPSAGPLLVLEKLLGGFKAPGSSHDIGRRYLEAGDSWDHDIRRGQLEAGDSWDPDVCRGQLGPGTAGTMTSVGDSKDRNIRQA